MISKIPQHVSAPLHEQDTAKNTVLECLFENMDFYIVTTVCVCVCVWLFTGNARKKGWEVEQAGLKICKTFGIHSSSSPKPSYTQMSPQNLTKDEVEQIWQSYPQCEFVF